MGKISVFIMGLMFSVTLFANPSPNIGSIVDATSFPVEKLIFFETDNNERGVMSDNGRFVIVGDFKIVDTWRQKEITTIEGVKLMKNLPINQLKEPLPKTAHFIFGHGEEDVFIFTDLSSSENVRLFSQIDDGVLSAYKFHLVYSSMLNNKYSLPLNKAFLCSKNQDRAKSILAKNIGDLPLLIKELSLIGEKPDCSLDPLMNSALLAKSAGVKRVPFIVNSAGITKVMPQDLKGFLNE